MGGATSRPVFSPPIGTYDLYRGQKAELWFLSIEALCKQFHQIDQVVFITENVTQETRDLLDSIGSYLSLVTGKNWEWSLRTLRAALVTLEDRARPLEKQKAESSFLMKGVRRATSTIESTMENVIQFRRSNPATCTLISAGIGAGSYFLLPTHDALRGLGFDENGIRKGSLAARFQRRYGGNVPRGSMFSYGQSVSLQEPSFVAEKVRDSLDRTRSRLTHYPDEYDSFREEEVRPAAAVNPIHFKSDVLLLNILLTIRQQEMEEEDQNQASSSSTGRDRIQEEDGSPGPDASAGDLIEFDNDEAIRSDLSARQESSPFDDPENLPDDTCSEYSDPGTGLLFNPLEPLRHSPRRSTETLLDM